MAQEEDPFDPNGLLLALKESAKIEDPKKALLASLFAAYQDCLAEYKIGKQKLALAIKTNASKKEAQDVFEKVRLSRKRMEDIKNWVRIELKELSKKNPKSELVSVLRSSIDFFDNHD